ncbi:zinc-dependent metalloprotease [Isoptericola sp. F-RaC21]|uniref:zinc-dependent metalloprotease n=1 Tax=Isoptericola sp. F-RaC21 TaxID=3141452 RepID=UPI00315B88A3
MSASALELELDPVSGRARLSGLRPDEPLLLLTTVVRGVGASGLGLDRGQPGDARLVHVRLVGPDLLLVQDNKHHGASGPGPAGRAAGADSFATSVLWSAAADEAPDGSLSVDVTDLAALDLLGVGRRLRTAEQGDLRLDAGRSRLLPAESRATADGVELTALLTLAGEVTGELLAEVVPDPGTLTVTQRTSLLPAPEGFAPRAFHPAAGGYGKGYADHAAELGESVEVRHQPRFRLEPGDDGTVERPVVFWVDPGIPGPVRDAVVEGASWWKEGFEAAGLRDAFDVRVRPDDVDPFGARTSHVWWVHRTRRGWSQGSALTDPRTGEIVRGQVRLGSQRVHQLTLFAEALLTPYGRPDEAERLDAVRELVLARVRQLAAHEVGHALGFMHNYASHRHPHPSVMDYPHPRLRLDAEGEIDLAQAYAVGLGPWDVLAVRHAYGPEPADDAGLGLLRRETAAGPGFDVLPYLTDADGHDPHAASPDAVPWVQRSTDPLAALADVLAVRRHAVAVFGPGALPPGRQAGELEERFVVLHLLHRFETVAAARLLGGQRYGYALAGEAPGVTVVPGDRQEAALSALLALLADDVVTVPRHVVHLVVPPAIRYERGVGYIAPRRGLLFDPAQAAAVAATVVLGELLDPARLNRLAWQHDADPAVPGPAEVVRRTVDAAWALGDDRGAAPGGVTRAAVGWAAVQVLARTRREGGLHPWVAAEVGAAADEAATRLRSRGPQGAAAAAALTAPGDVDEPPDVPLGIPL